MAHAPKSTPTRAEGASTSSSLPDGIHMEPTCSSLLARSINTLDRVIDLIEDGTLTVIDERRARLAVVFARAAVGEMEHATAIRISAFRADPTGFGDYRTDG